MPPKQKFTREEVVTASLALARREGIAAITARRLGAELGVSSRPIFTAFRNMEEVLQETAKAARDIYNAYVEQGLAENPAFKGVGMQYFRFARDEPKLFEWLFMSANDNSVTLSDILPAIDEKSDRILDSIQTAYGFSRETAYRLYQVLWIFTHGLACLHISGITRLTEDEVSKLLTEVFTGMFIKLKSEGK
jgi:AcrR family transcriptional regulator